MIDKSEISLILDVNRPNIPINQRFLQGNNYTDFKIQIAKDGKIQTITDGTKPTIMWLYDGKNRL